MGLMASIYYQPDEWGLRIVADIDLNDDPYGWHEVTVWRHRETGKMYWATDSGCSCNSPYDEVRSLEDLSPYSYRAVRDYIASMEKLPDAGHFLDSLRSAELAPLVDLVEEALEQDPGTIDTETGV